MIPERYLQVLRKIVHTLQDEPIQWTITGSLGMALQGVPLDIHDIDLQTDKNGAYAIEGILRAYVVSPVTFCESERMRSYLGKLQIDDIQVEIIGDIQKRRDDQTWEDPVKFETYRKWHDFDGMQIPVMSLEYEYKAYSRMGRTERADLLRKWLDSQK